MSMRKTFPSRTNQYAVSTTCMTNCHVFAHKTFFLMLLLFLNVHVCLISLHYSFIHPTNTYSILCIIVLGTEDETRELHIFCPSELTMSAHLTPL